MGELTDNYGLYMPAESDSMADVDTNITTNFETLSTRGDPTVIAAGDPLPQAGDYELGDRVFRNDPAEGVTWPSVYILVCKSSVWGWHWRPVQQVLSPWVDIPDAAIDMDTDWEWHPTFKGQIALDSKGWCHWRGVMRHKTAGIPSATTFDVFREIPLGIRPNISFMHTCGVSPVTSSTGKAGNRSGRFFMRVDGYSSFRTFNTDNGVSQHIWLDGLQYNNSYHWYNVA